MDTNVVHAPVSEWFTAASDMLTASGCVGKYGTATPEWALSFLICGGFNGFWNNLVLSMVKTMNNNIKEHPIQFEADMIRALLQEYSTPGEHKNQTRRTCGLNQFNDLPEALKERGWEIQEFIEESGSWLAVSEEGSGKFSDIFIPWIECPYGKVGDRLWVQEEICHNSRSGWLYSADGVCLPMSYPDGWISKNARRQFIPSIHMPRWASRILLEITEIRVERLLDITTNDARMEGIECVWHDEETDACLWRDYSGKSAGLAFAGYLSSLCGKK